VFGTEAAHCLATHYVELSRNVLSMSCLLIRPLAFPQTPADTQSKGKAQLRRSFRSDETSSLLGLSSARDAVATSAIRAFHTVGDPPTYLCTFGKSQLH